GQSKCIDHFPPDLPPACNDSEGIRGHVDVIRVRRLHALLADRPALGESVSHRDSRAAGLDRPPPSGSEWLIAEKKGRTSKRFTSRSHRQADTDRLAWRRVHRRSESGSRQSSEIVSDLIKIS